MRKKPEYSAMPGARFSRKDAAIYGRRLSYLAGKTGYITPEMVVDDARRASSPLHRYFTWSDEEAAAKWRIEQAKYLIRHITITVTRKDAPLVRHFFSVTPAQGSGIAATKVYVTSDAVMTSKDKRHEVVEYALKELEGWMARYAQYSELFKVTAAIKRELKRVKRQEKL